MIRPSLPLVTLAVAALVTACGAGKYLRGGTYRDLDDGLTIVKLTEDSKKYLDREIVFSVRYFKKGELACPLGKGYVNLVIADRVSYITLNKVWIKTDKARGLGALKEMETIVMKARVFAIDREKDPNLEALEILPE
jgi:hypothetical protein